MPRPLIATIALALLIYLACFNSLQVGQHVDDANYVMGAQSLLSGHGYRQIAYPHNPPEAKYPPLLSLLIVPFLYLTGGALWATRLPALLSALAALIVLYYLLKRFPLKTSPWPPLALIALHPLLVGYAGMPMTEAPSLLLTWAILLFLLPPCGARASLPASGAATLGLLLGLALLLRTDALALVAAVLLYLILIRQWRATLHVALLAAAVYLPWQYHLSTLGDTGTVSYLTEFRSGWWDPSPLPLRLWHGLTFYLFDATPQLVGLIFGTTLEAKAAALGLAPVMTALKVALGLLVIAGFLRSFRTFPFIISLFVLFRLAMLVPMPTVTRYLLPLLPFLIIYLILGLSWACDRLPRLSFPPRAQYAVLALLLIFALGRDVLLIVRPPRLLYPDVVRGGAMIRQHVPPDGIVASSWSAKSFYLHSGHKVRELSVPAGPVTPNSLLLQPADTRYLLFATGPDDPVRDLTPLLQDARFTLLAEGNGLTLLKLASSP